MKGRLRKKIYFKVYNSKNVSSLVKAIEHKHINDPYYEGYHHKMGDYTVPNRDVSEGWKRSRIPGTMQCRGALLPQNYRQK